MKLAIKYIDFSAENKTVGNCQWWLQKPVATHYLLSLNTLRVTI